MRFLTILISKLFNRFCKQEKIFLQLNLFNPSQIANNFNKLLSDIPRINTGTSKQQLSAQTFFELAERLDYRYSSLGMLEYFISNNNYDGLPVSLHKLQLEYVNRIESYYQHLYAALSGLAMLVNLNGEHSFKRGVPISSVESFLKFIKQKGIKDTNLLIDHLLEGVNFRNKFIDHIQQHALHNWMTLTLPSRVKIEQRICVVIYFIYSDANKPKDLERPNFDDPYNDNFVLPFAFEDKYVSPRHDEIHKAFFELTTIVLTEMSKNKKVTTRAAYRN